MSNDAIISKQTALYIIKTLVIYYRQAFRCDYDPRIPGETNYQPLEPGFVDSIANPDVRVWASNLMFFARYIVGILQFTMTDEDLSILDTIEGPPEDDST